MDIYRENKLMANKVYSSFDDSFYNTQNNIRQLAIRGRNNVISVGNCGMSTVNFSEFLSCLGMTVQETTTLTATFTETSIRSITAYNTWTVMGCTPAGFPYQYCPSDSTPEVSGPIQSTTVDPNATGSTTVDPNATGSTTAESIDTGSTTADSIDTGSTTADSLDTGLTTADSIDTGSTTTDSSDAGSNTIDSTDIETTTDFVSTDTNSPTTTTEQIAP
jgi:hypothetical protein